MIGVFVARLDEALVSTGEPDVAEQADVLCTVQQFERQRRQAFRTDLAASVLG